MGVKKKIKLSPTDDADVSKRMLTDMRLFYHMTDWASLWEEFYTLLKKDGTYVYKNAWAFAQAKSESKYQKLILFWYIGHEDEPPANPTWIEIAKEGAQNWAKRRKTRGWFTDENTKKIGTEIALRTNALDALREIGGRYSISFLHRADALAKQLDKEFKGTLFGGGDPLIQQGRAFLYLKLHRELLDYFGKAQELYANSHGVSFNNMDGLMRIVEATAMAAQVAMQDGSTTPRREISMLSAFAEMTMQKAAKYQMSLPPDAEEKIIDAVAQSDEGVKKRKKVM